MNPNFEDGPVFSREKPTGLITSPPAFGYPLSEAERGGGG